MSMIEGNWAEQPDAIDLFFKDKYKNFNKKWEQKFGWRLYKPLDKQDEHLFTALHSITSNNIKAFCEQTLTIVKLTIDRLNEKELVKGIEIPEGIKGIGKLEKFLEHRNINIPDMEYFGLSDSNYKEVLDDILEKSIFTLNTLEKRFLD